MLRFPRALWLAAFFAVTLALPSLLADFYCDDQAMVLRLENIAPAPVPGPFHLYTFASGAPEQRHLLVDGGPLPWWTFDGLRLSFFRPLSSALFAFDHAIAGRRPLFYHVHSIAWYTAAVLVTAMLLRRVLPEREAALAALLFAVSPAHWMLASWPSARHGAISGALAMAAIALHLRARRQPGAPARLVLAALACAALGLAAGETALGAFAYVAAYEGIGRREPIRERVRALAPWGALFLAYAALYAGLGFGVRGSSAYVDPIAQTGEYLARLPTRLAVFANAALLGIPSELSTLAPQAIPALATMGAVAVVALAMLLRRARRTLEPELARTLAWLLAGAALAVLPGAAGIPGDRILFMPNLGIASALAVVLLHAGVKGNRAALAALPARAGVAIFGLVHIVLGPLLFAFGAAQLASSSHAALAAAVRAEIPARDGVNVVGIGLADPLVGMYLPSSLWIAPRPEPRPRAVHVLTMSPRDHVVRRTDARTLEITIVNGVLLQGGFETVVRPPSAPLRAGDTVPLGAWTVRIVDDDAGRPKRFSVTFDRPADDPSLAFVTWRDGALRAWTPPPIGQEVTVKHAIGPMGI
ncbi:hypothetical protein [Pendulispora albinea]|uniref:Uncharacterized protein n=1 Tax=Pendulispora albinea TaxID=2741071 RepID=A0ABZ2LNC7_9BACT